MTDFWRWNRRQFIDRVLGPLGLLRAPLAAQEMGMGKREGRGKRLEAPYTLEIETPHVKWAKPLPGGPIRLLAVPTVDEGRTVVELAQRLSLDLTTVTIDPAWDLNKWTMCFGEDYGARAERGDLNLIYSYLEEELASASQFEAMVLPLVHGWRRLTPRSREAVLRRVREGCGLLLIHPFASEVSPLVPLEEPPSEADELDEPRRPGRTEKSPWRSVADHYITRAIPVETFPSEYVEQYLCRPARGAQVLIESASGNPILAVKEHGKGRVAAFSYRATGISWHMPVEARNGFTDAAWEYFYALLCRALIYVARREPTHVPDWSTDTKEWRLRDRFGKVQASGKGPFRSSVEMPPGRHFLEQHSEGDWKVSVVDRPLPGANIIRNLRASKAIIAEGDSVEVTWESSGPATVELIDALGRVIARQDGVERATLKAGRPLVHSGWIRATAGGALEQIPVRFAASSREWTDYEILMPWYGPRTYQPWIPAVDEQFRRIGITALATPNRNFRLMTSSHLPGFGIYWYRREKYLERKAAYAKAGDKKYLTRDVVLQSPAFEEGLRRQLDKNIRPLAPLKPFAYYLADESSLTCYGDAFDVDWSPEALAGFRAWLEREYGSLEKLNATWGTSFANWDTVLPMTTAEAQKHGNYAPWADHRAYMEQEFVKAFAKARDLLKQIDPKARASISGTQVPTAHNGCNWYEIDQLLDYLQPYSGGNQDPMHHLFNPNLLITGFTGYELTGDAAHYQQWERLFYGHRGASIFWHYTLLNPDLAFSEQGKALAETFTRIQSGIGRVFIHSKVREDGVAIHFSMASVRGAWITDGAISARMEDAEKRSKNFAELMRRRDAWVKELERRGLQFRFLASPQIERGALKDYRVLILPYSIALSDREAREIERFIDRGGVVYGDEQTGRMDERCRWRKEPLWPGGRNGFVRRGPGDVGVKPPVEIEGDFLRTVRDFGRSLLIGLLPHKRTTVPLPKLNGVVYDLLRGGIAAKTIEVSPSAPLLLLERPTRIARFEIDRRLNLRLADESGAPVDRSVARVEVFDSEGRLARHYSGNVTIVDGAARFRIPFAANEAGRKWGVRARDVVSSLIAEREVTALQ